MHFGNDVHLLEIAIGYSFLYHFFFLICYFQSIPYIHRNINVRVLEKGALCEEGVVF